MTLMKSNTTRRSHPMMRSRLRKPTSKSMTTVFLPRMARPAAIAAAVVVLPTPPLPEVTTITSPKADPPPPREPSIPSTPQDDDTLLLQQNLRALADMLGRDAVAHEVSAGDADELGLEPV